MSNAMRDEHDVSRVDGFPLPTFDSNSNDASVSRWFRTDQCPSRNECPAAVFDDVKLSETRMDGGIVDRIKVVEANVMGRVDQQMSALSSRRDSGVVERVRHAGSREEPRRSCGCERRLRR